MDVGQRRKRIKDAGPTHRGIEQFVTDGMILVEPIGLLRDIIAPGAAKEIGLRGHFSGIKRVEFVMTRQIPTMDTW